MILEKSGKVWYCIMRLKTGDVKMDTRYEYKKALKIGTVSIFSYIASYYMRHILGVSTPGMLESGLFTKEFVGTLSSVYFLIYAIGQLINGVIGDTAKPKIMVSGGLIVCGAVSVLFSFIEIKALQILCFAVMGFALSMLRGPLVKTISENTLPQYARVCCVFFSFASFAGPLIASGLSILFDWKMTFIVSGLMTVAIGVCAYTVLTVLERKNVIRFSVSRKKDGIKNIFAAFKLEKFVFYMFVGALVEISAASIGFWMPTYLSERLGYAEDTAKLIFSGMSVISAVTPFISLAIFKLFKEKDVKMIRYAFILSVIMFAGVLVITNKYVNVVLMLLARMAVGAASALLWSVYIPSQGKSGLVSTINGVLDFSGYLAASILNAVFAFTMNSVGWNGIIVMWVALMAFGVVSTFMVKKN